MGISRAPAGALDSLDRIAAHHRMLRTLWQAAAAGAGDRMSGHEVVITKSADQRVQVPRPGSCIGSAYTAYRICPLPLLP